MNENQRSEWIDNDEGLYNWWQKSHQNKRKFMRENREGIDLVIRQLLSGEKRAHYLAYPDRRES